MTFQITHYIRQSPNRFGWTELPFITKKIDEDGDFFYLAYNLELPLSQDFINQNVHAGRYKKLYPPIKTDENNFLWISPNGCIWLANKNNPFSGQITIVDLQINLNSQVENVGLIPQKTGINEKRFPQSQQSSISRQRLIGVLNENYEVIWNLVKAKLKLLSPPCTNEIDGVFKGLMLRVEQLNLGRTNLIDENEGFETYRNRVYYKYPTLFLYPCFLDQNLISNSSADVLQHSTQEYVALLIHKNNPLFRQWKVAREAVKAELPSGTDHELDRLISVEYSIGWLINLIKYLSTKNESTVHTLQWYVFYSIIQEFTENRINFNNDWGRVLKQSIAADNITVDLPYYTDKKQQSEMLNSDSVLLLDAAEASGVRQNGRKINRNYRTVLVKHGLKIPVGIVLEP